MTPQPDDTRDRVRALVREVLENTPMEGSEPSGGLPEHVVVNSLRDKHDRMYDRDESAKTLLTEDDLRGLDVGARVRVSEDVRFTPLARDIVNERGIELIYKAPRSTSLKVTTVAVGADHGGFAAKEHLKGYLTELGIKVRDFGTNSTDAVDYPDFAHSVARAVSEGQTDAGILIDGAGIGSAMAANKVPNVRAAACYSIALARNSREHNGANVLTLGSGQNSVEEMEAIAREFLSTDISEVRHKKRVEKIDNIERQYRR